MFELTEEGCVAAKKWLKDNNLYPSCIKYSHSTTGWEIIGCANSLMEKMNEKKRNERESKENNWN